ncbi:hypothetical protein [Xanthomonas cannabis]|uniref:hypothetical protein n=1 Tax=Xanthomonas cannabis TaxID=1885674 RepID=UPI003CCD6937
MLQLTSCGQGGQHSHVAAQSATGFDSPNPEAHQRPSTDARRFFVARCVVAGDCLPVLWRAVRGGRKACRSSGRSVNRVPFATSFDSEAADSNLPEDPAMSHDTRVALTRFSVRIAHYFGEIADTLDWDHSRWLALDACLQATGKHPDVLTLAEIQHAITGASQEAAR